MNKRKRLLLDILMFCVLIGGTVAVLYPFVSDAVINFWDQQVISYYQKKANSQNRQAIEKEKARMAAENERIAKEARPGTDPFSKKKAGSQKADKDYFQKHTIAVLQIPKIRLELPVFNKTDEAFLKRGTALLEGTSYPVGGKNTHAVITGHRGLMEAKLFNELPQLKKGNHFYIEINGRTLAYQVDQIQTIEPTEVEELDIVEGKDYVTLLTCTPYGVNSHRLLVRGTRVPFKDSMKKSIKQGKRMRKIYYAAIIIGGSLLILLVVWVLIKRFKTRKKTADEA